MPINLRLLTKATNSQEALKKARGCHNFVDILNGALLCLAFSKTFLLTTLVRYSIAALE